jgi:hypothetical protein
MNVYLIRLRDKFVAGRHKFINVLCFRSATELFIKILDRGINKSDAKLLKHYVYV